MVIGRKWFGFKGSPLFLLIGLIFLSNQLSGTIPEENVQLSIFLDR